MIEATMIVLLVLSWVVGVVLLVWWVRLVDRSP